MSESLQAAVEKVAESAEPPEPSSPAADAPDVVPKDLPATPDMAASEATVAAAVEDAAEAVAGGVKLKS